MNKNFDEMSKFFMARRYKNRPFGNKLFLMLLVVELTVINTNVGALMARTYAASQQQNDILDGKAVVGSTHQ